MTSVTAPPAPGRGRFPVGPTIVVVATLLRLGWAVGVPTIPVGDFATYRESARYLVEFRHLDHGFVYMPGLVLLLAAIESLGGEVMAEKVMGALIGGLATAPIYLLAARLSPGAPGAARTAAGPPAEGGGRLPVAPVAAGLYAVWPAGIAISSVIGTDIPAAAFMLLALMLLVVLGDARPRAAAAAFGAAMGLASYFRAVALPLTVLSAGYWLVRRAGVRATALRTAIAVAATLLVLSPWAARNWRQSGELSFTDSHGGITALMGNDPNTEGTYSRSLGLMFHELTGRTFLTEPHRQTDAIAYRIARSWVTFDPLWTVGMIALRVERLFAAERALLYWPLYRPGMLPPATAAWFGVHRALFTNVTDAYYFVILLGVAGGIGFAVGERRLVALLPLPFALALAATYALFVAEPRYRLTTEVLLFPLAGLGLARLADSAAHAVRRVWRRAQPEESALTGPERRGLLGTLAVAGAIVAASVAIVAGGGALRERHRWAVALCRVDGKPALSMWRRDDEPREGPSPIHGAGGGGVRLAPPPGPYT